MKTKLLFILLFISSITFSQSVPTNGLQGRYEFNNNTQNSISQKSMIKNNTGPIVHTFEDDRFNNPNRALRLNNGALQPPKNPASYDDYLSNVNNLTVSFWFNSMVNAVTASAHMLNLKGEDSPNSNGIGINYRYNNPNSAGLEISLKLTGSGNNGRSITYLINDRGVLMDGNWHHVVMTVEKKSIPNSSNFDFKTKVYIDNVLKSTQLNINNQTRVNSVFGNTHNNRLKDRGHLFLSIDASAVGIQNFKGELDDIYLYNRVLSATEVNDLYTYIPPCTEIIVNDTGLKSLLLNHADPNTGVKNIDTDGDGKICVSEARSFTGVLNVGNINFSDPTGIEAFVNATGIHLMGNQSLTSINLTALTKLEDIQANGVPNLQILGVSNLTALKKLNISGSKVNSLSLSTLTNLEELTVSYNTSLNSIDLSSNTKLKKFYAEDCTNIVSTAAVKEIDFTNNISLEDINVNNCGLEELDVSANTNLKHLYCTGNTNLTSLNVANGNNASMGSVSKLALNATNNSSLTCIQTDSGFMPTSSWSKDTTASYTTTSCITYTLTTNATNGIIRANPLPTNGSYPRGTVVTLTAIPNGGSVFTGWSGDATGTNSTTTITMSSNKTVRANFKRTKFFVDLNATGSNDGTSWANAYTSLKTALQNATVNSEIWVAKGTYKPSNNYRIASIFINKNNVKIYGGFAGTEVNLADRDISLLHTTNKTTLSGDFNNNDSGLPEFNNSTRADNAYTVVTVSADNVTIDGFTISGGHCNGTSGNYRFAAGVRVADANKNFTIKNSVIRDNYAFFGSGIQYTPSVTSKFTIDACVFKNNASDRVGSAFYTFSKRGNLTVQVTNSLFEKNKTFDARANGTIRRALGSAAGWVRAYTSGTHTDIIIVNNTFINNRNEGTGSSSDFPTFGISGTNGSLSTILANNIFWGNTNNVGSTAVAFGKPAGRFPTMAVSNSIDQDNFSRFSTATKTNIISANPQLNSDFTLRSNSPAVDAGDNAKVPSGISKDLAGKQRIQQSNVDIGAYEYEIPAPEPSFVNLPTSVTGMFTATISFNSAVTGFAMSDIQVTNASLSNFNTVSATEYTVEVTPSNMCATPISLEVPANVAQGVSNNASNTTSGTSTVTVIESVPPTAVAQNITVQLGSNGSGSATAQQVNNGSSDNCTSASDLTLSLNQTTFNCSDLGNNSVVLSVTDASGNTATDNAVVTVVDNRKPNVVTQNNTLQLNGAGTATLQVSDINNGSSDNCTGVTSLTYSLSKTNFNCSDLGANTVTLTVTDSSGNVGTNTATITVEDRIAPTAVAQNFTVQLNSNNQASITTTQINNGSSDNCTSASNLTYSLSKTTFSCLDLGANTVVLTVTDSSGNQDTASAVVTVNPNPNTQLQAVTQNITVALGSNGQATITPQQINNGSGSGCNSNPTLSLNKTTFSCSDIGANTVTLTVVDGGTTVTGTATVTVVDTTSPTVTSNNHTVQLNAGGTASIVFSDVESSSSDNCSIASRVVSKTNFNCSDLGANTVVLTVTDSSGNVGTNTATVTVEDRIVPTAVAQNFTVQLNSSNQASITPSQINNGSSDNCTSASNLTYSLSKTTFSCSDLGTNTVVLTVTDSSGNQDTANAVVTVNPNPSAQLQAVTQNISVSLGSNGQVVITPQQIDNGSGSGCNGNPTLSLNQTTFSCSDIGANTVTLTVVDGGTTVTGTATVTVVDTTSPTVTSNNHTVQLNSSGTASIVFSDVESSSSDNCSIASKVVSQTNFNCSDVGANTVVLTVTDSSGNVGTNTATVTVEDRIAPTAVAQNLNIQLNSSNQASITPSQINNGSSDNCTNVANLTYSLSKTTFSCSDLGTNTVVLTVTDSAGNQSTANAFVTVAANPSAPLVVVTQNITVPLGSNGQVVITPQQIDNGSGSGCNSNPTLSLNQTTFTCSDIGANTVTLTVASGGTTLTQTAVVTVVDTSLPTVLTKDITVNLDANGQATITAQQVDNGSSDNCSIASMTLDKTNFSCADLGTNTVTMTVVDANGNSKTGTAKVIVQDTIAPTALAQNLRVQLNANNQITITASQLNNGSSDNCTDVADLIYSLDKTSFSCTDLGTNNVVLTVTDSSGNTSTITAVVTIVENPNALLSVVTQNITVSLDANGQAVITPDQIDNGSGSGCNSNPTLRLDTTSFDCSNIGANTVTLTVSDGARTKTGTAIVTVVDTLLPTVLTQEVTLELDAKGEATLSPQAVDNGSSDNCSIASMTLDKTSFTCSDLGLSTVTLTVTDSSGNVSTKTAAITVKDNVAPTVVTQNITVALNEKGEATITAQDIDKGSVDNCSGIASMSLDKTSFQCPTLGDYTVVLTVTDNSGNTSTGTAIVTITGSDEDNDGISDACDSKEVVFSKGFSPNGDGTNDTWVVGNLEKYPNNRLEIFNRSGKKVFSANNYQNDWSGDASSATKLPVGSYLYILDLGDGSKPLEGWIYINY